MTSKKNMKISIAIALIALTFSAQAQTSEDHLTHHRETDTNKDGVRSSYIYKNAGKKKLALFVDAPEGHTPDAKVPVIVFFHGGGFKSGSEKQFEQHAKYLAKRGMVAVRVRYRLISEKGVEIKDCVEDAISAMRWVRSNADKLGVDPDRIAAGGGSAGGYLSVATLMIEHINAKTDPAGVSAKPNALVLFNPGFGAPNKENAPDPRDKDGKGELSQYVKPNQPPMIHFFGSEDPFLPGARRFIETYKQAGNRCELITYEGEAHSFFNKDKYFELTIAQTDKFLTGLGWLKENSEGP